MDSRQIRVPDDDADINDIDMNHSSESSKLKFRNYEPQTQFLEGLYTITKSEPESIVPFIRDKLDLLADNDVNKDDTTNNQYKIDKDMLEFKKVDWDLKRRIEKRLEKLERETRKQIDKHIKTQKQPRNK